MSYYDRVYEIARRIPRGRAATYGQIALMTGSPRAARAVGYAMAACTFTPDGRVDLSRCRWDGR